MTGILSKHRSFIKDVFILALPVGIQQVINLSVNLIDNLMIGSLGEASISAVAICGTYCWLANTFVNGLAGGAVIIAAQDWGNQNLTRIRKLFSFVLTACFVIGVLFLIVTALFPVQILRIYSNAPEIIEPGVGYLNFIKYTFPLNSLSMAIMILLRSVRSVKLGLYNSITSCFSNVFFNWVFIYGHLGFPAMGAAGAALGTLIARGIELIVSLVYLFCLEKNLHFRPTDFQLNIGKDLFFKFIKITAPLLIIDVLGNLASSVQTMITGRISTNYVSANSIVHMAWQIPNVFCWGIGMAASIMIGNSLGRNDKAQAYKDSLRFIWTSVFFGLFSAVMVQVLLPFLIQFYNVTEATRILAKEMGYSASITVLFLATSAILCNGVIKSGGYTHKLLRIDLLANWLVAIPLGLITAFYLKWPAPVIYLVLRSGNILKTIWGLGRLKKGDWMQNIS